MNHISDFSNAVWHKSARRARGCVEVATLERVVGVRDSKDRQGPFWYSSLTSGMPFWLEYEMVNSTFPTQLGAGTTTRCARGIPRLHPSCSRVRG